MPNLVVYVPVGLAERLMVANVSLAEQRRLAVGALELVVEGPGVGSIEDALKSGNETSVPTPGGIRPSRRPAHRADPKTKAAMEHGRREPRARDGMCEHRIPAGAFCKVCDG